MNVKNHLLMLLTAGVMFTAPALPGIAGQAQAAEPAAAKQKKSVKVPAMRDRVYSQLARAQKLADEGERASGFAVLDKVKDRLDSLNPYEKAMLFNFYGFMHYAGDDIPSAIASFEQVVKEQQIPESLLLSTCYSLAQLNMQQQNYTGALAWLEKWQAANSKPLTANQQILMAQVHFQLKQYQAAIGYIELAVAGAETAGDIPKENWLVLQRAAYYELGQSDKVTLVMEALVRYYDKAQYWLQLGGMYGETGQEKKQLAVMEAAWQAGYVVKSSDIISLAQLYLYHGVPYKAAKLLDEAIEKGDVIAQTQYLDLLAQAYVQAKEDKKAIPVLKKAAEIADNGKFDEKLAQAYLNLELWPQAITSAEKALERGQLHQESNMHLVLGMAQFNLQNYDMAIMALQNAQNIAQKSGQSQKMAKQWLAYVKREKGQQMKLAKL
ncbi:tetratricopeptide repeat protein [Thalassomonas actiniarum]|uniref:Tetratricopeptide repeat protein n=1 Tax=Thalassomonas actiniarum TaxID=485447 RepID=A0AAF0C432_9GAMM|nr:CDC27 family protein [Thalassomonas actiniarum]WDE00193.1 tetratricopeptide repeat protein [Thalassomonas actiniarum]